MCVRRTKGSVEGGTSKRCKRYRLLSVLGHLDSVSRIDSYWGQFEGSVFSKLYEWGVKIENSCPRQRVATTPTLLLLSCMLVGCLRPWHVMAWNWFGTSRPEGNHLFFVPEKLCTSINLPGRTPVCNTEIPATLLDKFSLCFSLSFCLRVWSCLVAPTGCAALLSLSLSGHKL